MCMCGRRCESPSLCNCLCSLDSAPQSALSAVAAQYQHAPTARLCHRMHMYSARLCHRRAPACSNQRWSPSVASYSYPLSGHCMYMCMGTRLSPTSPPLSLPHTSTLPHALPHTLSLPGGRAGVAGPLCFHPTVACTLHLPHHRPPRRSSLCAGVACDTRLGEGGGEGGGR